MIEKKILDIKVNFEMTMKEAVDSIDEMIQSGGEHIICTTNPEFILKAQEDDEFKRIINECDLSLVDGSGVLFAYYYLKEVEKFNKSKLHFLQAFLFGITLVFKLIFKKDILKYKVSGSDLFWQLCALSNKKKYSIFLLGGWPQTMWGKKEDVNYDLAKKVKDIVRKRYPEANIIGATSQFNSSNVNDSETVNYIQERMTKSNTDVLDMIFVAYGQSKQEKWLDRNMNKIPAKVGVGVGGTYDYVVGNPKRAPNVFRRLHIEWLYRLVMQPWRIKRICMAFLVFPAKIYIHSIKK